MEVLFDQIRVAIAVNLYYLALYSTLTIPDICGAMSSKDGWASKEKYIEWFDTHVAVKHVGSPGPPFSGADCYEFRCALLHQGSGQFKNKVRTYDKVVFVEPRLDNQGIIIHNSTINNTFILDVPTFCNEILDDAERWLQDAQQTPEFKKNYERFAKRNPDGLKPYVMGQAVIG